VQGRIRQAAPVAQWRDTIEAPEQEPCAGRCATATGVPIVPPRLRGACVGGGRAHPARKRLSCRLPLPTTGTASKPRPCQLCPNCREAVAADGKAREFPLLRAACRVLIVKGQHDMRTPARGGCPTNARKSQKIGTAQHSRTGVDGWWRWPGGAAGWQAGPSKRLQYRPGIFLTSDGSWRTPGPPVVAPVDAPVPILASRLATARVQKSGQAGHASPGGQFSPVPSVLASPSHVVGAPSSIALCAKDEEVRWVRDVVICRRHRMWPPLPLPWRGRTHHVHGSQSGVICAEKPGGYNAAIPRAGVS
jgi:hypothetical protein